jgi:hypothetical protein
MSRPSCYNKFVAVFSQISGNESEEKNTKKSLENKVITAETKILLSGQESKKAA